MRFSEFGLFDNYIDETVGEAGRQYEFKVFSIMQKSGVPGLNVGGESSAGFSRYGSGDIQATFNNQIFNIEVKLNSKAQMGSGSLIYDRAAGTFTPTPTLEQSADEGDLQLILATAKAKKSAIDAYLDSLAKIEPINIHAAAAQKGVPFVASKQALSSLKDEKFLASINAKLKLTADHIARLYNKKDVFYIQIGGAGLFFLGSNPLNLPVPKFEGEANIEFRFKPAGDSKGTVSAAFTKKAGSQETIQARSVGLICAARFLSKASSQYTLDNEESIRKLFDANAASAKTIEPAPKPKSIQNLNKSLAVSQQTIGQEPK